MTNEEKLLLARCEDLFKQCDKYAQPRFSDFLNEAERAFVETNIGNRIGYNCCFFGGYDGAQRTVFAVFPDWLEEDNSLFPIKVLKVIKKYKKELSHRDYLGTVLSKGIDRCKVGDILISGVTAYIFIAEDIAEYIAVGIEKISNVGVKISVEQTAAIVPPEPEFETINTVAASTRLDAVIAAVLNVSRKIASQLILDARVSVNHIPVTDTSYLLKPEQVLSVRGHGRFIFVGAGAPTRSQRLHIEVKKFV